MRRKRKFSRWQQGFCNLLFFEYVCWVKTIKAMTPVKLKVYISYTPEDKNTVKELYEFLRPMHDEVDIWYNDPPAAPKPLPTPWELFSAFLPIFVPRDYREEYAKVDKRRKERAHIYLFMTSYKSLNDARIQNDIRFVAERRVENDWLSPQLFPVIMAPSMWKEKSPLAKFKTLGPKKTLIEVKPVEEGYYEIATQLSKVIRQVQRDMDEAKFAQSRLVAADGGAVTSTKQAKPYLGGEDETLQFKAPAQVYPPEWLGWLIWIFIFLSVLRGLKGDLQRPSLGMDRYESAEPAKSWQPEYRREQPMQPVSDDIQLPKPN